MIGRAREIAARLPVFEAAARLCDRHELGIRAADALHLAIAMDASATLLTF
ncbi:MULTISPECIES: PIN domain-containing protein [unclassified Rhizobium]|uniref:hypothetical protein n=1 Tax=unclassified Rhizobium TaxID=2613769 RepID=UPI001C5B65FA|nr:MULTISPECIES: hypothetical protein [unclassified Rhizobium]QXZ85343.1 hypothetical protein J5287_07470 [Rhizobium sp. K1/93]QXZ90518.1 hypothetical protein J5280_02530 [Rhizobium sp. K15/93]